MNRIPTIIDIDPGIDDAAALFIALTCSRLDTRLITTAGGSIDVHQATANALKLEAFLGSRIWVSTGIDLPNSEKRHYMEPKLGPSGLGNWVFADEAEDLLANLPADEAMYQTIKQVDSEGKKIYIICLAPLSNLASLLIKHPEVKPMIGGVYCMGTTLEDKDTLQQAGRNVAADPDAARVVVNSGLNVNFVPLEVAVQVPLSELDMTDIALSGRIGNAVYTMLSGAESLDGRGKEIADPVAVALAIHPNFFTIKPATLTIGKDGKLDVAIPGDHPNVKMATAVNRDEFVDWFKWALERASR